MRHRCACVMRASRRGSDVPLTRNTSEGGSGGGNERGHARMAAHPERTSEKNEKSSGVRQGSGQTLFSERAPARCALARPKPRRWCYARVNYAIDNTYNISNMLSYPPYSHPRPVLRRSEGGSAQRTVVRRYRRCFDVVRR